MANPIRLFHAGLSQYFIVDGDRVYADLDGDGLVTKRERYSGPAVAALAAANRHFTVYYDAPFPGARSLDPQITSGGRLNDKEAASFSADRAVPAKRSDLLAHLDFFDQEDGDGVIGVGENFRGWRTLGYGVLKALMLTVGSAIVFGRAAARFGIDVERIAEKRPKGSTGIYGPDGDIDRARLAAFAAMFDGACPDGVLTHDRFRVALAERAHLGSIPRRQFESLLLLTARINGSRTVTKDQFLGLFDNSLFWAAASIPDRSGRRALGALTPTRLAQLRTETPFSRASRA
jgi:hypothetical protein